jgi:hypothetical protein
MNHPDQQLGIAVGGVAAFLVSLMAGSASTAGPIGYVIADHRDGERSVADVFAEIVKTDGLSCVGATQRLQILWSISIIGLDCSNAISSWTW